MVAANASCDPYEPNRHNAVGAWFLGPRAENFQYLKQILDIVLDHQATARRAYYPNDQDFVTTDMQDSPEFKDQIDKLTRIINGLAKDLSDHSVPFWSPRYNAHMLMDTSLPGIAGYLTGMLFNPNNVALEASPLSSYIEKVVGLELSELVGFNVDSTRSPMAWGHVTCGGSIANLEAVWAARNLKFYPLSLTLAMSEGGPLDFIADTFELPTCMGEVKLFRDFTTWELLNIIPEVALDIPDRLYAKYSLSPKFLQGALENYLVQTLSKDCDSFEKRFGRENINRMAIMTCATKHYSWPKSAAVTGIGSENLLNIRVDHAARMDMTDLRAQLDECLNARPHRAIYMVTAIIGSTEHGACDPLDQMVKIRNEYRKKGLSFVLHADGAWGTYFASMIPRGMRGPPVVPSLALKPSTLAALLHMRYCDSVTVDPHKSGYVQYPAGGLLYRDGRMRYQVTWTSPIVFRDDLESMGVYGIEGSKPGAAPIATWVSHQVIGLNPEGYGELLGEALFSCVKMYCHLVTMSRDNDPECDFVLRVLNMLPTELEGGDVKAQKEFIRTRILNVPNEKLIQDKEAMKLIHDLGSDFAINAFVVNFKVDGKVNEDVIEANDLNTRIFKRCSIVTEKDDINQIPLQLTSTEFPQDSYAECLTHFKKRLGLKGKQNLYTLINVVSSPFPTTHNFTSHIASELERIIEEEVKISQFRNKVTPDLHGFVLQGTDKLYLVHLPMFNLANHRYQLIISGDLPADIMAKYVEARKQSPEQVFVLGNTAKESLEQMLKQGWFDAVIHKGLPGSGKGKNFLTGFKLTNVQIVIKRPLDSKDLDTSYPRRSMPFYLYGTQNQIHIDHALLASPNIQINADQCQPGSGWPKDIKYPVVAHFQNTPESAMQPFPDNATIAANKNFFFQPGKEFQVIISRGLDTKDLIWKGPLTIGKNVFVDVDELIMDPQPGGHHAHKKVEGGSWAELIGKYSIENSHRDED